MPISGQYQLCDAYEDTLPLAADDGRLIGCVAAAAAPAFSLEDDSDSNDSVHQFLACQSLGRRDSQDANDEEEDEEALLMDCVSGSPYGDVRTRPPSPRRPITGAGPVPFRAAASAPSAQSAAAAAADTPATAASSQRQRPSKKRQTRQSATSSTTPLPLQQFQDDADDDDENGGDSPAGDRCWSDAEAVAKRRRVAAPPPPPLGDASNRGGRRLQPLARCQSESCGLGSPASAAAAVAIDTARIDRAIASIDSLNLIGNSEQGHALPTVKELDFGIRYVTPGTVARLLAGQFADRVRDYAIVDCRYPYEFGGGHIRGAVNLYRPEELLDRMLNQAAGIAGRVIIFHCEFSSERAPRMARLLRQRDREINSLNYPQLHYPELYLLQGGYKAFYEAHKADCDPSAYTRMADPEHKEELAHFSRLGRAWERQNSRSKHSRLQRMAGLPMLM